MSAGVPSYHEPRETYTYRSHTRDLGSRGNEHSFHRVPSPPTITVGSVTVRVEEICLVLVVLMLWAGAITLFINRWVCGVVARDLCKGVDVWRWI